MNKRSRNRRSARRSAFRDPKSLILILTEGESTEPEYIKGLSKAVRNPRVEVLVVGAAGASREIVTLATRRKRESEDRAKRENDDNLAFDEVWCVFDVDDHKHIPEACRLAHESGIELAISNPCFELWLLLHFRDQPGMQHRKRLLAMMKKYVKDYDKRVDFADYQERYQEALRRAEQLDKAATNANEEGRNPTTGMWRLVQSICNAR